jgi:cytochrome b561
MRWKSTTDRYGAVAIAIHWTAALLILVLLVSGLRAANTMDPAAKIAVLRVHAVLGVSVLVLTLARIGWWFLADVKPVPAEGMPPLQERAARVVHVLFYVVILGMAASGIGMIVLSGAGLVLFGGAPGPLPDFWQYPPRIPHRIGAILLIFLFVLHVGAALYHQFILRDRLLARMGIGRAEGIDRLHHAK